MGNPPTGQDWRKLHLWQIQPLRDAMVIAGVLGLLWLGYALRVVTVPLLLAMTLAYLFEPLVGMAEARRWLSRKVSAGLIILLAGALILVPVVVGGSFAAAQGVKVTQRLVTNADTLIRSVDNPDNEELRAQLPGDAWRDARDYLVKERARSKARDEGVPDAAHGEMSDLARVLELGIGWARANAQTIGKQILSAGGGAVGAAVGTVNWIVGAAFGAFLTAFFFFFICTGYGRVIEFWRGLVPEKRRGRVVDLLGQMDRVIAGFVRGRLTIAFILMLYYTLGYWIVGVPAPLILGPAVGLLTLVPYGAGIGVPVAMVLMWLDPASGVRGEWWWIIGGVLAVHGVQQVLDDYVLTPRIQGKTTNMDTPSILFASIAGGVLAGFYGLLLAIPAAACVRILLREVFWPRFKAWSEGKAKDLLPISGE